MLQTGLFIRQIVKVSKLVPMALLCGLLLLLVSVAFNQSDVRAQTLGIVETDGELLNVREGPSSDYGIRYQLDDQSYVQILGLDSTGTWYEIRFDDESGRGGWVFASYIYQFPESALDTSENTSENISEDSIEEGIEDSAPIEEASTLSREEVMVTVTARAELAATEIAKILGTATAASLATSIAAADEVVLDVTVTARAEIAATEIAKIHARSTASAVEAAAGSDEATPTAIPTTEPTEEPDVVAQSDAEATAEAKNIRAATMVARAQIASTEIAKIHATATASAAVAISVEESEPEPTMTPVPIAVENEAIESDVDASAADGEGADGESVEEASTEAAPAEETPAEETPAEEASNDAAESESDGSVDGGEGMEDAASAEAPEEEIPAAEAPTEEAPTEEVPVGEDANEPVEPESDQSTDDNTSSEDTLSEEAPTETAIIGTTPANDTPAEDSSMDEPSADGVSAVTKVERMNVYSGPGTHYTLLATVTAGATFDVMALDATSLWYQVEVEGMAELAWAYSGLVETSGDLGSLPQILETIPTRVPQATPTPTQMAAADPNVLPTPTLRPMMEASDPTTFEVASGQYQVVEFFGFW